MVSGFHVMSRDLWSLAFHILEKFWLDPSVPLEGYKWAKSELWKRVEEFNFERKVTLEKSFTSYWVYIPLSFYVWTHCSTPKLFPTWLRTSLSLLYEISFGGGLKWWRPSWKGLSFSILNALTRKFVIHTLMLITFNRNILFSSN